ncbi:hypothetical protein [Streptomyces sp. NPDC052107]|uniref:hypothetical protein n=1 Tax=Streptomyces sp. NPDC052107 TaxID=3155632 RepID=UPI00342DCEAF
MLRGRRLWWAGGGVFALTAGVLGVVGGWASFVIWLCVPGLVACGCLAARGGFRPVRAVWVLRARGVTAEGRLESSHGIGTENGPLTRWVYSCTDARGTRRECIGADTGGAAWVRILYDPADPDGSSQVGTGTAGMFVFGVVLLLVFGIPVLVGAARAAVIAVTFAFS